MDTQSAHRCSTCSLEHLCGPGRQIDVVRQPFEPGQELLRQGRRSDFILHINRGGVSENSTTSVGDGPVIAVRGPGATLNLAAALGGPSATTVVGITPGLACRVPGRRVREALARAEGAGPLLLRLSQA